MRKVRLIEEQGQKNQVLILESHDVQSKRTEKKKCLVFL